MPGRSRGRHDATVEPRIVVDTSVFVGALLHGGAGANREVVRRCLLRRCTPLMGEKLLREYESVLARDALFRRCPIGRGQRDELFAGFAAVCDWTVVHYLWRPNLPDEGDNHVLELALAGGAQAIVTQNVRDFRRGELRFPGIEILNAAEFLRTHG